MIYKYDAAQEKCPLPLVNTRVILRKMIKGDSLLLRIADAGSLQDIPKLLDKLEYSYTKKQCNDNIVELQIHYR